MKVARRCEIIAEVGINHNGNMETAQQMIRQAAAQGADVIKFQLYKPVKLLKPGWFSAEDWAAILASELTEDMLLFLYGQCQDLGIEFMASAFDTERLSWLEKLGVKRHKIASRSVYDEEYVERVKATGKPVLVSMGWAMDLEGFGVDERVREDFEKRRKGQLPIATINRVMYGAGERVRLLYCISKYPTELNELKDFPQNYSFYDGFSDHTQGLTAAKAAIARGARVIEKHFTLDPQAPGPDQVASMTPAELGELVRFRDEYWRIISSGR